MGESLIGLPLFDDLQIIKTGVINNTPISISSPGAGNYDFDEVEDTVSHDLGYTPIVMGFLDFDGSYHAMPLVNMAGASAQAEWSVFELYADDTSVRLYSSLKVYGIASSTSQYNIRYFLMRERANSNV